MNQPGSIDDYAPTLSLDDAVDKARAVGRDVQAAASDLAHSSGEALMSQASRLKEVAKDAASQAGDHLQGKLTEQKGVGADRVSSFADAMRRAAGEFDSEAPIAGTYIREAAAKVESAADSLRNGDLSDLVRGAQTFAKSQPTAFVALAAIAGFAAVRFLKSAPAEAEGGEGGYSPATTQSQFGQRSEQP